MKVEDVMTREVRTVSPDASLKDVAEMLSELRVSGLPVVQDGRILGVVSEADILTKERGEAPNLGGLLGALFEDRSEVRAKLQATTAGEAMTAPAITISAKRPVSDAAARMIDLGVNRLPVVDDAGMLVGIVTRADLVRAFVRSDDEIAREIREDVVLRSLWIEPDQIDVQVDKGAVTLIGRVETKTDAELVPAFVKRVPGVVSVESRLTWLDDHGRVERVAVSTR